MPRKQIDSQGNKPQPPSRDWTWTLNNYTDEEVEHIKSIECRYISFGKEIAPTTGTPHLQGYIYFHQPKVLAQVKKLLGPRVWFTDSRGTAKHNTKYTCKDEDIFTKGKEPRQGKRNDLGAVRDAIQGYNLNNHELLKHHPGVMARYPKYVELCRKTYHPPIVRSKYDPEDFCIPLMEDFRAVVLIGLTEIGKTQYALCHFDAPLLVRHMDDLKQFNADVHDGIVFDDMRFTHIPPEHQIHLLDWECPSSIHARYECGGIPAETRKIFTCNPTRFPFTDDEAINRRFVVKKVTKLIKDV